MNFSQPSSNFNSSSQQQSQQPSMNAYTGQYFSSMMPQYQGYPPYYPNNYPYGTNNYVQSSNHLTYYSPATKNAEIPSIPAKREHKPLIVFDPHKKEVINLEEVSKLSKSNSLISDIKNSSITSKNHVFNPHQNEPLNLDEVSIPSKLSSAISDIKDSTFPSKTLFNQSDILNPFNIETVVENNCGVEFYNRKEISLNEKSAKSEYLENESDHQNHCNADSFFDKTTVEECNHTYKDCINDEIVPNECNELDKNDLTFVAIGQSIKVSKSIPNKLETLSSSSIDVLKPDMSSSEDNLFQKLCPVKMELDKELDKNRLMYDRETMIKLSKSPLCRKPNILCNDIIENQAVMNYNLSFRLKNSNDSLKRTANGYLPPHLRLNMQCSLNKDLENNRRLLKCILNKIAPQNFELCFNEIKTLITSTDVKDVKDYIDCLIEEIFDKSVQQEAYSVTYANLCTQIVKYDENFGMKWSFKPSLIERCKNMFETPLQDQLASVRLYWENRIESENDEKLKNLFTSDIEEQVKKAKDKYFGNIRFIGELYLHDLLKAAIINLCVITLMAKSNEEDAIFSLCKLLETCGKKFDKIHPDKMKEYISSMTEIADAEEKNTRVKYRLYDIIEMKERKWTLRRVQAQKIIQPTTLDKVKKDDLDEKNNEASKISNRNVSIKKKQNNNAGDLKFKVNQNKNQSMDINSLQISSNDNIELKPAYGVWSSGSGSKDPEWQSVDKRSSRFNKPSKRIPKIKSSPVTSRDDSPLKSDIGGRFALLQQNDIDITDCIDSSSQLLLTRARTPEYEKERCNDTTSTTSTRDHSPNVYKSDDYEILDADGIYQKLIETGSFDKNSWNEIADVSKTIANWLDKMMEKTRSFRNMLGDELSKLVINGLLSIDDLMDGIKYFLLDIDDLKPDIPLIWNFLAEFIERFIVNSESDISFYKTIFDSTESKKDVTNCILLCIKYAVDRLGQNIIHDVLKKCSWSFEDFVEKDSVEKVLRSMELNFLLEKPKNVIDFDSHKTILMSLLPNDDEEIYEYLDDAFDSETLRTEECVYFVSCCVFNHIANLVLEDVPVFLLKKKLFFVRLLDRRSELEMQTLRALNDAAPLLNKNGLLAAVIYGLSDNIISNDAFYQFIQKDECCKSSDLFDSSDSSLTTDVIRSMLQNHCR